MKNWFICSPFYYNTPCYKLLSANYKSMLPCLIYWKNNLSCKDSQVSVASLFTPCFVMFCVFLYGPFCHGAHKLDLSTLFTTFFLWTSPPFILESYWRFILKQRYLSWPKRKHTMKYKLLFFFVCCPFARKIPTNTNTRSICFSILTITR